MSSSSPFPSRTVPDHGRPTPVRSSPLHPSSVHLTPLRLTPLRRAALLTAGVTAALALGSCTTVDDDEDPLRSPGAAATHTSPTGTDPTDTAPTNTAHGAAPTYARYVALGDSFAALGPTSEPTSGPGACLRSTANYAAVLAASNDIGELVDVSCGGAQTRDMTAPQIAETPPQFDALTASTDLVTLSIGGNDIGFGPMVECIVQAPRSQSGAPCRDRLNASVSQELEALGANLDEVYAGIRERSPGARIVATAYLPLVPSEHTCGFVAGMSPGDVTWAREVTERINTVVADAADRAGAQTVLPEDADERHACAPPAQRYTDFTGVETGSHPMHPTAAGHRAMAEAVAAVL